MGISGRMKGRSLLHSLMTVIVDDRIIPYVSDNKRTQAGNVRERQSQRAIRR